MTPDLPPISLSAPTALDAIFAPPRVLKTIKRMTSRRDRDDLITNPIRALILIEFANDLATTVSRRVISGHFAPGEAYLCLTTKRSGGHRELVFPSLIDAIVGRRIVDELEPAITEDDDEKTFCGRSHSSSNRAPGDYSSWFQVWLDYSSAVAAAAERAGFAYIYDTDVADFFPSMDRPRAKQILSQRTHAHPSVLELLFLCLETWLPRFSYMRMHGIPVEPNDVSRLVAHNFLKVVDQEFTQRPTCMYLRYVDDTAIFCQTEADAAELKRAHHIALRKLGLNPSAAKSSIVAAKEFQTRRHPDVNRNLGQLSSATPESDFHALVKQWWRKQDTPNWDQVAKRFYREATRFRFKALERRVVTDLKKHPAISEAALHYLTALDLSDRFLEDVLRLWNRSEPSTERLIWIARYLCDGCFSDGLSQRIADFCVGRVQLADERPGTGHARGLLLLALNKHGSRRHRQKVLQWASDSLSNLDDPSLRLHFAYVFICRGEILPGLEGLLRQMPTSDLELTWSLCQRAIGGTLTNAGRILQRCVTVRHNRLRIEARYLPIIHAIARSGSERERTTAWIDGVLTSPSGAREPICDVAVQSYLRGLRRELTE